MDKLLKSKRRVRSGEHVALRREGSLLPRARRVSVAAWLANSIVLTGLLSVLIAGLCAIGRGTAWGAWLVGDRDDRAAPSVITGEGLHVRLHEHLSVLYPRADGSTPLVVLGEIENLGSTLSPPLMVQVDLVDDAEHVMQSGRAVPGVVDAPFPGNLAALPEKIAPYTAVPFAVPIEHPARGFRELRHRLRALTPVADSTPPR
jgi:hypothetical protein